MIDIRLNSQGFNSKPFDSIQELVQHFGCMQAQDIGQAKRCLGSRIAGSTVADVDQAIADKQIVRTRPMRGTLHYMDPSIVRWMLKLCASKTLNGFFKRREYLGISDKHADKTLQIMQKSLSGGEILNRDGLKKTLEDGGVPMQKQRVYHLACYAGTLGLICFGPPDEDGKDTFVLLEDWIPAVKDPSEEEQLATLARMYLRSHGPARVDDLARWTGLGKTVSKKAIALISDELEELDRDGQQYFFVPSETKADMGVKLLGGFDEYFLGYKDRAIVTPHAQKYFTVNGIFFPLVMQDGKIIGKWKRKAKTHTIDFEFELMEKVSNKEELEKQIEGYCGFWRKEVGKITY